jgi:hypothetical protein
MWLFKRIEILNEKTRPVRKSEDQQGHQKVKVNQSNGKFLRCLLIGGSRFFHSVSLIHKCERKIPLFCPNYRSIPIILTIGDTYASKSQKITDKRDGQTNNVSSDFPLTDNHLTCIKPTVLLRILGKIYWKLLYVITFIWVNCDRLEHYVNFSEFFTPICRLGVLKLWAKWTLSFHINW